MEGNIEKLQHVRNDRNEFNKENHKRENIVKFIRDVSISFTEKTEDYKQHYIFLDREGEACGRTSGGECKRHNEISRCYRT
jgi:hypothetical protein